MRIETVSGLILSLLFAVAINSVPTLLNHLDACANDHSDSRAGVILAQVNAPVSPQDYSTTFKRLSESYSRTPDSVKSELEILYKNDDAAKWLISAAEHGNSDAQFHVGRMYDNGLGVAESSAEAVKWYRKAAEHGSSNAQNNLGWSYVKGWGVAKDYKQGLYWIKRAVEEGNVRAQNNLGVMYMYGWGVAKDYKQSVNWLKKAAEQGNAKAQSNLGYISLWLWGTQGL